MIAKILNRIEEERLPDNFYAHDLFFAADWARTKWVFLILRDVIDLGTGLQYVATCFLRTGGIKVICLALSSSQSGLSVGSILDFLLH